MTTKLYGMSLSILTYSNHLNKGVLLFLGLCPLMLLLYFFFNSFGFLFLLLFLLTRFFFKEIRRLKFWLAIKFIVHWMLTLDLIILNQFMRLRVVFRLSLLLALRCSLDHQNEIIIHLLFILLLKKIGVLFFIRYLFLSILSLFSLKVFISYVEASNLTISK